MENLFVVYLREQAFIVEKIAKACPHEDTGQKLLHVSTGMIEKAAFYEELVTSRRMT
jgi:hypothetical protein